MAQSGLHCHLCATDIWYRDHLCTTDFLLRNGDVLHRDYLWCRDGDGLLCDGVGLLCDGDVLFRDYWLATEARRRSHVLAFLK